MIDVDYFKQYNDTYGHDAGDALLKTIGHILHETAKKYDFLAYRVGGDEFAAVGFEKDLDILRRLCEELLERIRRKKIPHEANPHRIATVTIGAGFRPRTKSRDILYRCADRMLYRAALCDEPENKAAT